MSKVLKCLLVASVALLSFLLQLFYFSPISPQPLQLPPPATFDFPWNNQLQRVTKLGEGILKQPEDVWIDDEGTLFTATRDGWIKKMYRNGTWESWVRIESDGLLGLVTSSIHRGQVFVCDATNGLLKVDKKGMTVLASHINGSRMRLADDLIEASDGKVYFSDASTSFVLNDWHLDLLEAKPHGRLLVYDPSTKETSVLLDGLAFANGIALSKDKDYVVVCETWKFRCLKYFLTGNRESKTEILIENLPGAPDNVKLAPDGSFWIALLELRFNRLEFLHKSNVAKHILAAFPKLMAELVGIYKKAMVVNVGIDGKIIKKFDDANGKVMSFVTSVLEFEDHLYLGSLNSNFIGKLQLR